MKLLTQEQYDVLHPRTVGDFIVNLTEKREVLLELDARGLLKIGDVQCSNCGGSHPSLKHTDMGRLAMRAFRIIKLLET